MRAHGHIDFNGREPYLQTEVVQKAIKESINLRYDLTHYIYTISYLSTLTGLPLVRPMWLEFPKDKNLFEISS